MQKPNCYQCKHRADLCGDAHSRCTHPAFNLGIHPALMLIASMHASRRVGPIASTTGEIIVRGNPHGIARGWFMHPLNYDPVWLEECNGFEAKQSIAVSGAVSQAA